MRYLGIDFGEKRIGIALSDAEGDFAYAHSVVANGQHAITEIVALVKKEGVEALVMGESKDYSGKENTIMPCARAFAAELALAAGVPLYWEPEFLTSAEAGRIQGEGRMLDASAAALILKSYLGRTPRVG